MYGYVPHKMERIYKSLPHAQKTLIPTFLFTERYIYCHIFVPWALFDLKINIFWWKIDIKIFLQKNTPHKMEISTHLSFFIIDTFEFLFTQRCFRTPQRIGSVLKTLEKSQPQKNILKITKNASQNGKVRNKACKLYFSETFSFGVIHCITSNWPF